MGLDSYWLKDEETHTPMELEFEPELNLISGIMSGSGSGSFRGKAYSDFIERISGISLYQETMPNSEVHKIANALEDTDTDVMRQYFKDEWGFDESKEYYDQHINDLTRMFRAYADAGAILHGWW
jgi:hypothetical protein